MTEQAPAALTGQAAGQTDQPDQIQTDLSWGEKALDIAGYFLPMLGVGIGVIKVVGLLAKLLGYASSAEPTVRDLATIAIDKLHTHVITDTGNLDHIDQAHQDLAVIEATPGGRIVQVGHFGARWVAA